MSMVSLGKEFDQFAVLCASEWTPVFYVLLQATGPPACFERHRGGRLLHVDAARPTGGL